MHGSKPWPKQFAAKAKKGVRGYPVGTLAFYGPDNRRATKVVAAIIFDEGGEAKQLRRWFGDDLDVRIDRKIGAEVVEYYRTHGTRVVAVKDGIWGCPHEEGIDYPLHGVCPQCPYWAVHDRDAG